MNHPVSFFHQSLLVPNLRSQQSNEKQSSSNLFLYQGDFSFENFGRKNGHFSNTFLPYSGITGRLSFMNHDVDMQTGEKQYLLQRENKKDESCQHENDNDFETVGVPKTTKI